MRGLKLIQNGVTTYAPYNQHIVAMYEERNRNLIGAKAQEQETVTILTATPEEVEKYLLAEKVESTAGVTLGSMQNQNTRSSELDDLRAMVLKQNAIIDKMLASQAADNTQQDPDPVPAKTPSKDEPAHVPAKTGKKKDSTINLSKSDEDAALAAELQDIE